MIGWPQHWYGNKFDDGLDLHFIQQAAQFMQFFKSVYIKFDNFAFKNEVSSHFLVFYLGVCS